MGIQDKKNTMEKLPKILKIIFICIFTFQLIGLAILFILPNITSAAEVRFSPQVEFPGFDKEATNFGMDKTAQGYLVNGNSIGVLIRVVYKYLIGTVGILATIVMMIGGFIWLFSAGNSGRIGEAKKWIGASMTGLILALTSYMILATVNPKLTEFKSLDIRPISELTFGCCIDKGYATNSNNEDCKGTFYKNKKANGNVCVDDDGGCCGTDYFAGKYKGGCRFVNAVYECDKYSEQYSAGKKCNEIEACPQYGTICDGSNDGYSCGTNEGTKVCKDGNCVSCENDIGDYCTNTPCCADLWCDTDKDPDTCRSKASAGGASEEW